HPGSTRACTDHCHHSRAVDRNDPDSLVSIGVGPFLGGRQSRGTVPRFLAVGRSGARWLPEPCYRHAEFFGLWGLAVKLSSILRPITYGSVTWITEGNHR